MSHIQYLHCFAAAAVLVFSSHRASAQVTYTAGDILVGFQADGGDGAGTAYVFNLGQGHTFRDATAPIAVGNLATDLSGTYGPNWFTRTDLHWAIGGVRTNASFGAASNAVINGDPARCVYVGKATATPGASTPWVLGNAGTVTTGATEMMDTQSGFVTTNGTIPRTPTPASGGRGVLQDTGDINNWTSKVDSAPWAVFTGAAEGAFGTTGPAYLDLYRILAVNDKPGTVEVANVGLGVLQGTFSLNSSGVLSFTPPAAVATGYDVWADAKALAGADRAADADPDGDGVKNVTEFVLGTEPKTRDSQPIAPSVQGGFLQVVFRRTDASAYLNPAVEFSSSLAAPWTKALNGSGGVVITTDNDAFGAGVDRVTVAIPASGARNFARLTVTK